MSYLRQRTPQAARCCTKAESNPLSESGQLGHVNRATKSNPARSDAPRSRPSPRLCPGSQPRQASRSGLNPIHQNARKRGGSNCLGVSRVDAAALQRSPARLLKPEENATRSSAPVLSPRVERMSRQLVVQSVVTIRRIFPSNNSLTVTDNKTINNSLLREIPDFVFCGQRSRRKDGGTCVTTMVYSPSPAYARSRASTIKWYSHKEGNSRAVCSYLFPERIDRL